MLLCALTQQFFTENSHLKEIMDKDVRKIRGYGILILPYEKLRFGLPLRSYIQHKFCFHTLKPKGLDYTKAVLLCKDSYISSRPFHISQEEFDIILEHTQFIEEQFVKFITMYRKAVINNDKRVLAFYRYSTLQNYHKELDIPKL